MNNKLVGFLLFTAGVAVGSGVTWKLVKTKYERIAQEEIDSVKETFGRLRKVDDDSEEVDDVENDSVEELQDEAMDLYEYEAKVQQLKYASAKNPEEGGGERVILAPYVISPDMFGEDDYETSMLTYYADGVLEDDYWNVIENVEDIVGTDFVAHFGEYTDDIVFIRNEELHTDYEITRDKRTHAESQMYSPHGVSDNA